MKTRHCSPTYLSILLAGSLLGGCGGNGGSDADNNAAQGIFVDSPVTGLEYTSGTFSGVTGPNGEFRYLPGETVEFFIGDILLGTATGDAVVTPLDLLDEPVDSNDPRVVNLLRLLQTLDDDGVAENGIVISPQTREQAVDLNLHIDFSLSIEDFAAHPDVLRLVGAATNVGQLIDADTARSHFQQTMAALREDLIAQVVSAGQIDVVVQTPSEADLQRLLDQFAQEGMPFLSLEITGTTFTATVDLQQLNRLFSSALVLGVDDFRPVENPPAETSPGQNAPGTSSARRDAEHPATTS